MTIVVRLVLASASPARLRLLQCAGIEPEVLVSAVDEDALAPQWDQPADIAQGLAQAKALDVAARIGARAGDNIGRSATAPDGERRTGLLFPRGHASGARDPEVSAGGTLPDGPVNRHVPDRAADGVSQIRVLVVGCDSVLEMPTVPGLSGRALGKPRDCDDARRRWRLMAGQEGLLHTGHCLIDVASGSRFCATASTAVAFADLSEHEIDAYVDSGEPLAVAGAFTIDGRGGAFVRRIEGDPSNVIGLSLPLLRDLVSQSGVCWPSLWR